MSEKQAIKKDEIIKESGQVNIYDIMYGNEKEDHKHD